MITTVSFLENAKSIKNLIDSQSDNSRLKVMSRVLGVGDFDPVIKDCEQLIESHKKAKKIISDSGAETAGKKAAAATQLEKNNIQKGDYEAEVLRLKDPIAYFERKRDQHHHDGEYLKGLHQAIHLRKISSDNLIPIYGAIYAAETDKMANEFNRLQRDFSVLNNWINDHESEFAKNTDRLYWLKHEIEMLNAQNMKLQAEGGKICEILTIISRLIAEFEDFLCKISQVKNDLNFTRPENEQKAKNLIDESIKNITLFHESLHNKLAEYASELPGNVMNEVRELVA